MIPHDGPACPTPLEEEEEPPWDDASSGIVSSSIVKKTPLASDDVQNRILFKTGSQLFLCILPKPIVDYNGNIFHMNERFIM